MMAEASIENSTLHVGRISTPDPGRMFRSREFEEISVTPLTMLMTTECWR